MPCLHGQMQKRLYDAQRERETRSVSSLLIRPVDAIIPSMYPEAPPEAQRQRWQQGSASGHWAPIPAAPSVSRLPTAAW